MRLVLDEHFDTAIALELRRRGHDVVAVTEDDDLRGLSDRDLLASAAEAGRVIVTYNVRHFGPLSEECQAAGEPFAGLIFLSWKRYAQGPQGYGVLIRDLDELMNARPARDALSGRSLWLGSE